LAQIAATLTADAETLAVDAAEDPRFEQLARLRTRQSEAAHFLAASAPAVRQLALRLWGDRGDLMAGGTTLTRDANNDRVLTTLASNRKQTFRASDGLMVHDSDRNGVAYTFSYTTDGHPRSITEPAAMPR
jgi:hypothetical protein